MKSLKLHYTFSIICLILKSTLVREEILAGGGIDLSAAVLSKPRDQFVPFNLDPEMIWYIENFMPHVKVQLLLLFSMPRAWLSPFQPIG
jgi:hypothetical protein